MKELGILLPIFSLPSKYGIGAFGNEAYEFINILSQNNIDYWAILPINSCNSNYVYGPSSYYALNTLYISIDKLYKMKLISKPKKVKNSHRINFSFVKKYPDYVDN